MVKIQQAGINVVDSRSCRCSSEPNCSPINQKRLHSEFKTSSVLCRIKKKGGEIIAAGNKTKTKKTMPLKFVCSHNCLWIENWVFIIRFLMSVRVLIDSLWFLQKCKQLKCPLPNSFKGQMMGLFQPILILSVRRNILQLPDQTGEKLIQLRLHATHHTD